MIASTKSRSAATAMLAKDFMILQEERVRQYVILIDAHKKYLSTAPNYDFETYKIVVDAVTKVFKELSEKISEMRISFDSEEYRSKDLANLVGKVQLCEQRKLQFTVDMQLALQQAQDSREDELLQRNAQGLRKQLNVIAGEINESLEEVRYHIRDLEDEEC